MVLNARGFTLIELIITLVVVGIVSVTAIPKLLGHSTEDGYAYRDQTLVALRTMQLRAMQNTTPSACHTLLITDTLLAPPLLDTCTGGPSRVNSDFLVVEINTQRTDIRFNATDTTGTPINQLSFDPLGRVNQNCASFCRIDLDIAAVCVSDEGLVYGCQ